MSPPECDTPARRTALRTRVDDGRFTLVADPPLRVRLDAIAAQVRFRMEGGALRRRGRDVRDASWSVATWAPAGAATVSAAERAGLRAQLHWVEADDGCVLHLTIENTGAGPLQIEEVALANAPGALMVGAGTDRWSVYRNGYQSWSGTRTYRAGEADHDPRWALLRVSHVDLRHPSPGISGHIRSAGFALIKNLRSGEALCLGFLDSSSAFGVIDIDQRDGRARVAAANDLDGTPLAPGATLTLAPLWIAVGRDEQALLAAYADAVARRMQARVPARAPTGWCSWYYYFQQVRETHILETLGPLTALAAQWRCDYVMVDDGYEPAVGEWLTANDKFPHGMAWLAEQIRGAGFDAGIWLAPFIARPEARVFQEHPDWFVRTDDGAPRAALWNPVWGWRGQAYALDATHPEVLRWLRDVARTLAREWGYRILKLDFLFAAALPGRRYDASATRAQALRRGLQAIREGAGDDTFLIGCGCPLMPAIGIVDAMRIGADVAPFWRNWLSRGPQRGRHGVATEHAIRNTLTRAFMHRRWWLNDPDCLMVRAERTRLTHAEVCSLATAIALTDGLFVVSDRMDRLPPERIGLLARAAELAGGSARVVDLFERDLPELVVSRRAHDTLIGVFNFGDRGARKCVDLSSFGVLDATAIDAWTGAHWPVRDGWLDLGELPAHGSAVLCLPNSE